MKCSILFLIVMLTFIFGCAREKGNDEPMPAVKKKTTMEREKKAVTGAAHFQDGMVKIDGSADEWGDKGVVLNEVGQPHDGGMGGFDVQNLQVGYDNQNLYFLISMDKGVMDYFKAKEAGGTIGSIYLDTDGDTTTGCLNNKDIFGFEPLNGFDVHIWVTVGVAYKESGNKAIAAFKIHPVSKKRNKFESFKKLFEAGTLDNPENIQFKDKNLEFAIPLKMINIKTNTNVRGVISEFANSFQPGSANTFSVSIK